MDATSNDRAQPSKFLPTMIDHSQQSELSCLEAIETLECSLRQGDAYMEPAELFHRELFDAVLCFQSTVIYLRERVIIAYPRGKE